jgi:hypothetical protein
MEVCPSLLEKALEKVVALPPDEQDAIAPKFWRRWPTKRPGRDALPRNASVIRRMAQEAIEEDERAETLPLDDLP